MYNIIYMLFLNKLEKVIIEKYTEKRVYRALN